MVTLHEKQLKGGSSGHRPSWQRKKVVEEMAHVSSSRARRLLAQCPPEVGSFAPPLRQWELSTLSVLNLLLSSWGEQLSGNDFHHFPLICWGLTTDILPVTVFLHHVSQCRHMGGVFLGVPLAMLLSQHPGS